MSYLFFFLFFFFLFFFTRPSLSDPRATQAALICSNRTSRMPDRDTFIANFNSAMNAISPQITSQRFARIVDGIGNNTVYVFGECMKDLSQSDCNLCFAQCKTQILMCYPFQKAIRGGRLFYDGCYLRYEDYDFFHESLSAEDTTVCGGRDFGGNRTDFRVNSVELVRNLSSKAPKNDGFFVGSVDRGNFTVYGLAQCWEVLDRSSCGKCLENAFSKISSCLPKEEGRVLNAGCYLRYSTHRFYNNSESSATGEGRNRLAIILAATFSSLAGVLIVVSAVFFGKRELARRRKERKQLGTLFATGILSDGKAVAVKRGYMAPEYMVRGKLTEKADVYSFGVFVIEFICRRRNNSLSQDSFSILQMVWNLYRLGRLHEAVDSTLEGRFKKNEASQVLQIGLLCTQASAELRPSMSMVVKMLTDNHEIPRSMQPPFLNSNITESSYSPPGAHDFMPESCIQSPDNDMTESWIEPR
ncbi:hypothetical protein HHK36_015606 [Tetracentron sinense]|uniref:Gnk2-homologous domain-containing protein n=1 Tax=Tetracentron sinense TaxID=13715 RepID=A0A834Z5H5_TETSI|nr:hypothetical protein HHK36_015606 [Tetracentron sinense]